MHEEQLFIVLLVIAAVVLLARAVAGRLGVPDAIPLVVLGLAAGFVPGMPEIEVSSELVLMGFLPPLIYNAAFFTAPREARADAVPIVTLAFGLTAVTTFAVAGTVHLIMPGLGWPAAIAFGAAVAPTDAVAATGVLQRVGAPRRLVTILEGESLINDGVALTIFGLAVEALTTEYTFAHGGGRLAQVVLGGVAYGLLVGVVMRRARRLVDDPSSQIILSLATPYLAYVPAEHLGVSGVLATVVAGFHIGTRGEGLLQPASRVAGQSFWRVWIFLLESALFVLLGLAIRGVLKDPGDHTWTGLLLTGLVVSAVVVLIRLAWELGNGPLADLLPGGRRVQEGLGWRARIVVGLGGMRGAISLAIALSLPTAVGDERGPLIFLTALVVLVTLVGQASFLPVLLHFSGLSGADKRAEESMRARKAGLKAAMARLDAMSDAEEVDDRTADAYRQLLELRLDRVRYFLNEERGEASEDDEPPGGAHVRAELAKAQRAKLDALYRKGKIGADTLREIGRELDFADVVTGRGTPRGYQRE
ncbi:Na+/H+ antiporter [Spirillospora sp. CA-294931]|uniref:Na+/H+ antiporter n=1 Tax=Spirillospora sp. CA-294931 TaxID=3240042 RepID=UPI003D8F0B2B